MEIESERADDTQKAEGKLAARDSIAISIEAGSSSFWNVNASG